MSEHRLNDGDWFPEFHLEPARMHAFLPKVGERLESSALCIADMQVQFYLWKLHVKPSAVALLEEVDEGEIAGEPPLTRFVEKSELQLHIAGLVAWCECVRIFLAIEFAYVNSRFCLGLAWSKQ